MNAANFQSFRQLFDEDCRMVLQNKGNDYSQGGDRLSNFKLTANELGISPMVVWWIFFKKHLDAIRSYAGKGKVESESIRSRFIDARNYIDLGMALVADLDKGKCNNNHTWVDITVKGGSKKVKCTICGIEAFGVPDKEEEED